MKEKIIVLVYENEESIDCEKNQPDSVRYGIEYLVDIERKLRNNEKNNDKSTNGIKIRNRNKRN